MKSLQTPDDIRQQLQQALKEQAQLETYVGQVRLCTERGVKGGDPMWSHSSSPSASLRLSITADPRGDRIFTMLMAKPHGTPRERVG